MTLQRRINVLSAWGEKIAEDRHHWSKIQAHAQAQNGWFTEASVFGMLDAICSEYLDQEKLTEWIASYHMENYSETKNVGIIMAGNIPAVGFHDLLCCLIAGHQAVVKLSDKDSVLLPYLTDLLEAVDPEMVKRITYVERLKGFDAVIATGSNTSAIHFEHYFSDYPNIIRRNRNAIAVLTGKESESDLIALGQDIFTYFGLGCRNVSYLMVPHDYTFDTLLGILHDHYKEVILHHKYKNNFDYQYALILLNKVDFLMSGSLLVTPSDHIASPISVLHYGFYEDDTQLTQWLSDHNDQIQCIVSGESIGATPPSLSFGKAQSPALEDYADGVDTIQFLLNL